MEVTKIKWTLETYIAYNEALRNAENKFYEERNDRYQELTKVKENAHAEALDLAREIQKYKDEKANELREQINEERLLYVRKEDLKAIENKYDTLIKPISEFIAMKQGRIVGIDKTMYYVIALVGIVVGIIIAFFG